MDKKIRIAQLVWPDISIPPIKYGSIQSVVALLSNSLNDRGYDITTFTSGDSNVNGKIFPVSKIAVNNDKTVEDKILYHYLTLAEIIKHQDDFDIFHSHLSYGTFPLLEVIKKPVVITLHCIYNNPHLRQAYQRYGQKANFVTISNFQQSTLPGLNYIKTIYHGIELKNYPFEEKNEDYLLFAGRISSVKGLDDAIRISNDLGINLKVAGGVDLSGDGQKYFNDIIKPSLSGNVELLGELSQIDLKKVTSKAKAVICPFKWDEAFGLVMTESMACGTPVVAYNRGSVSEIVRDKVTGFICPANDSQALKVAVQSIYGLDNESYKKMRQNCRKEIESKFSAEKMVENYISVYDELLKNN